MNPLKALRVLVATLFLLQGTLSPASSRSIATQNVGSVERDNTRGDLGQDLNIEATPVSTTASPEAVVMPQTAPIGDWVDQLPGDEKKYYARVYAHLKGLKLNLTQSLDQLDYYSKRISKYLDFLMYNSKKTQAEQDKILFGIDPDPKKNRDGVLQRLTKSSTEFLFCANPNDFKCIEQVPRITPTAKYRVEDPSLKLGEVQELKGSFLDKIQWFFNKQLLKPESEYVPEIGVARELEKLIKDVKPNENNAIYMSLYGIDDVQVKKGEIGSTTGSMAGIYNALVGQRKSGLPIFGVFDTEDVHKNAPKEKIIFSYQKPKTQAEIDRWIFTPLKKPHTDKKGNITTGFTNMNFMYNVGTQNLVNALNAGSKGYHDAPARFEKPDGAIMHNKFFIFREGKDLKVWTGTTNIARTCLGTERNSNLSVVVSENNIGKAFMDEFKEMFDYASEEPKSASDKLIGTEKGKFPVGKFKQDKTPNTKRLFYFAKDQTFVRIHFSPTDDGEHRAVLPMLHSALPGDKIVISMFGATGIEYVRAIQYAAARGVDVQILLDSPTACGVNAWAGLNSQASLLEDNPYQSIYGKSFKEVSMYFNNKGKGEVWKQNHQKIGALLRLQADGSHLPEHFIFGSQNWSEGGNDVSDENMMSISRVGADIPIASDFVKHFEWLLKDGKAIPMIKAGCRASTKAYKLAHPEEDDEEEEDEAAVAN